jgi:acid phosphatase (class A)
MLGAGDPGLGASGDSVRLWFTNVAALGANTNGLDLDQNSIFLVDKVDTLPAPKGPSLICNTNNGTFGITNTTGVNGAFTAATTADVGSPGIASTNPGPTVIVIQPTNALVNVGATATFQIKAFGFPKPRFQWLEGGGPVDTNRVQVSFAVSNNFCLGTITITNVQVQNVGTFRVNVTNGFQTVVSSNATLTVNTSPVAPAFTQTIPATLYAYSEKNFSAFNFTPAIGAFFQSNNLPKTALFFNRVQTDAAAITDNAKDFYKRPRPYVTDPSLANGKLEKSFSYPSGHSTETMVLALVLADLFPDKHDAIIAEARSIGWHRVQIARHYPTDIYAGRVLAQAIVKQMEKNADFQKDLAAAKAEITAAMTAAKN